MKKYQLFLFFSLFTAILFSCDDFDDVPPEDDTTYFVSQNEITTYSLTQMNTLLTLAPSWYPELEDLIEPVAEELASDVKLVKISYNTTFEGENVVASGLVSIPQTAGTYPILSFQNGTNTLNSEAPSEADYTLLSDENMALKLLTMMASTGFVVAIPDYLGFGESDDMFHPYLDKTSTVQSVLDMLRAVKEMLEEGDVSVSDDLYITGYSQGGWATAAVQEAIDSDYAEEFELKASSCGSGPHKLLTFSSWLFAQTSYEMPYFLAYLINSYSKLGMTTPIDSIFQEPYAEIIPDLFDGTQSGSEINAQLTENIEELLRPNFIANWDQDDIFSSLDSMLESNSNSGYSTSTPTLLIHGDADTYVPSTLTENLYQEYIDAGVSSDVLELRLLSGLDHTDAVFPAELATISWFIELKNNTN